MKPHAIDCGCLACITEKNAAAVGKELDALVKMTNQEAMRGRARNFLLHFHLPPDSHEQVAELLCKFHAQEAAIAKIEDGGVAKERSEQSGNVGKVSGSTPDSPISEEVASRDARIAGLEQELADRDGIILGLQDLNAGRVRPLDEIEAELRKKHGGEALKEQP